MGREAARGYVMIVTYRKSKITLGSVFKVFSRLRIDKMKRGNAALW